MLFNKKKWTSIVVITLLTVLILSSFAYAERTKKVLEMWYNSMSIVYNGKDVTNDLKPFVDKHGNSYVPLRILSTYFDKDVKWNPTTYTATVTDKPLKNVSQLENQILIKDIEITRLENKIKDLEKELEDNEGSLDDLEDDLNDDYGRYERIDFDISLKEKRKDEIEVKIEIDLDRDKSRWNDLDDDDREEFIEDIVDDVLDEYRDAKVTGYIRDSDSRDDLYTFYTKSRGRVVIDHEKDRRDRDKSTKLSDLEDELDDDYYDYFRDITIDIELTGDSDDVTFFINVDYDKYKREWNKLYDSDIKKLMSKIYDDIEDEWRRADIEGYAYDTDDKSNLAKYYKTSSGSEKFSRW